MRPLTQGKRIVWAPQPGPQHAFIRCPYQLIFWGGARGGGKTDGLLGKYGLKQERYRGRFNAVIFRKEMPQADDVIDRALELYLPLGATFNKVERQFTFRSGARLRFRPIESVADSEKYQGQNLTDIAVEEVGNYADPAPLWRLFGALRSAAGVPTQFVMTGNPGGPGQAWIRKLFIDPAPAGMRRLYLTLPTGTQIPYIFIPSKVTDNRALLLKDPGYIDRLHLVGSPQLVRAWLEGYWGGIVGSFFPEFGLQHIIRPFPVPRHWTRFRAFDWGSSSPFSVGWWAVSSGVDDDNRPHDIPRGALVCYREWYGAGADGKGIKLRNEDIAAGILNRQAPGEEISYSVADPAIFKEEGGPSIAETFRINGVPFRRADNDRFSGWAEFRSRLIGQDGKPGAYWFDTCADSIRTIPMLQHDDRKPEDCDTRGEDHAPDQARYAFKSRPYTAEVVTVDEAARAEKERQHNELLEQIRNK